MACFIFFVESEPLRLWHTRPFVTFLQPQHLQQCTGSPNCSRIATVLTAILPSHLSRSFNISATASSARFSSLQPRYLVTTSTEGRKNTPYKTLAYYMIDSIKERMSIEMIPQMAQTRYNYDSIQRFLIKLRLQMSPVVRKIAFLPHNCCFGQGRVWNNISSPIPILLLLHESLRCKDPKL